MADEYTGWVKIERALMNTIVWNYEEPFDDRSAYIDLRLRANYVEKDCRSKKSRDVIHVKENELMTSYGHLADRWHWSKNKVIRYLKMLEEGGLIKLTSYAIGTVISLENIDKIMKQRNADGYADGYADGTAHRTDHGNAHGNADGLRLKKERKDKKVKENKKNQEAAQRPADCYRWEGEPE